MKIYLYGYDEGMYGDLDDAQEDGAIHLLSNEAGELTYSTLETIHVATINAAKAFADKDIAVFVKAGGIDYSHETLDLMLKDNRLDTLGDLIRFSRSEIDRSFKSVRARIVWVNQSQKPETVTIANTNEYRDLEKCNFCGKCNNCLHDQPIFYYADSLTELDTLVQKAHHDGWKIQSYSVTS